MDKQETVIHGVLNYRFGSEGSWVPYTSQQLTSMLLAKGIKSSEDEEERLKERAKWGYEPVENE